MLTHHRKPVSLSLISVDLPIRSLIETSATLYQKDRQRFHLLLSAPGLNDWEPLSEKLPATVAPSRLLWLEISPYRTIMTVQGNGKLSYRHLWENRMYGLSRYWLENESLNGFSQMRLRNFTRSLTLTGSPLPDYLRLEYELWSDKLQFGRYVLDLQIHH